MPLTPAVSREYDLYDNEPQEQVKIPDWGGRLEVSQGKLTYTAAGQGDAQMLRLPPGRLIIYPHLCRLISPAGAAGQTVDIGLGAYVNFAGETVAADPNLLSTAIVNTAALNVAFDEPATGAPFEVENVSGVDVTITVAVANSAAAGDVYVIVVYGRSK